MDFKLGVKLDVEEKFTSLKQFPRGTSWIFVVTVMFSYLLVLMTIILNYGK